jgi:hypothetical protein
MLASGDLQKKIEEDDLRGVTSNPTIFEKAITGSNDYDEQLRSLVQAGKGVSEIYEDLVVEDIGTRGRHPQTRLRQDRRHRRLHQPRSQPRPRLQDAGDD